MSIDYEAVCDECRMRRHAGQRFAGGSCSFGYGSKDEEGRTEVAEFCFEHADHGNGVRILVSDPDAYNLNYRNVAP